MKKKLYFENLDGIRFFCFMMVFMFHSFYTENLQIKNDHLYIIIKEIFRNGNMGVNFFFVLSGYLITYLLIEEKKLNGKIDVKSFWIRRILRIWPLYFFCVGFGFVIFPAMKELFGKSPEETANIVYYLTFTSNFDLISHGFPDAPILTILWSIAIEEQFYLIWPVILSIVAVKKQWIVFLLVVVSSLIFRGMNDVGIVHEHHTLSCVADMAVGATGAWLCINSSTFVSKLKNMHRVTIAIIYISFLFVFFFRDEIMFSSFELRIFERLLLAIIFLLIILEQNYADKSFFKLGEFKKITYLGTITYGLYCLHYVGILIATTLSGILHVNKYLWQLIFIETSMAFSLSLLISMASFTFYEKPFMRLKGKFSYITRE